MAYYRLYFMDPRSGHIMRFREYDALDDQSAIEIARTFLGGQPLELWCDGRKVTSMEARYPAPEFSLSWLPMDREPPRPEA